MNLVKALINLLDTFVNLLKTLVKLLETFVNLLETFVNIISKLFKALVCVGSKLIKTSIGLIHEYLNHGFQTE